ncbi:acyltransferase family protein [Enterovibrio norvegicus]|uniref:acyltransferase family protein n=1 Tax=Enterovibrio norvegicus TaxID=188144 RepID=UPI00352EA215
MIRHIAALMVLFSHQFPLLGLHEPTMPRRDTYGFLAVAIFFSISGYFMPASYSNSNGFLDFIGKRCKRIFPGLIVCSFIMVFIIGALFSAVEILTYVFSLEQVKTFIMFSAFVGRPFPTVFSDFIYPNAINGSLWTLPVEFLCYLIIGVFLSCHNSWKSILLLLCIAIAARVTLSLTTYDFSFYGVPMSYLSMFGIAFSFSALTKASWMPYRAYIFFVSLLMIGLMRGKLEILVIGLISIAIITIVIGVSVNESLVSGRLDISYGI